MSQIGWSRLRMSAESFVRTWGNPDQVREAAEQQVRARRYERLWDLYQGTAFDDMDAWKEYRRHHGLYRAIRQIWDHNHNLVEFYATHVWSGSLALDGDDLPDGVENAIPLAENTDPALAKAIGQLWEWWNWQDQMVTLIRYTAALGECLVEIRDDTERGKVFVEIIWPSFVKDIRLDESGNVTYYCIEYQVYDEKKKDYYTYKREVDKESFRTYKNGQAWNYDLHDGGIVSYGGSDVASAGSVIENPYGFVPACWFRHTRVLGVRGEPANWSTQAAFDELNSLLSHMVDKAHIGLRAPIIVAGNIAPNALKRAVDRSVAALRQAGSKFTEDRDNPYDMRQELNILEGPQGTEVSTIDVKISETILAITEIKISIERKTPEVTMYESLRAMTQLTGPAASRLLGDVEKRLRTASSGYDRQLIKLEQMGVAIAGWRQSLAEDGWAAQTEQQKKFAGFDLESYVKGDLAHDIMPRELVPMTIFERLQIAQQKKAVITIIPERVLALEMGYKEDEIAKWEAEAEKKAQEDRAMAQEDMKLEAETRAKVAPAASNGNNKPGANRSSVGGQTGGNGRNRNGTQ